MTGEDDKGYPLESGDNPAPPPESPPDTPPPPDEDEADSAPEPEIVVSRGVEALSLEEEVDFDSLDLPDRAQEPEETEKFEMKIEPESDYVKSLDICPNCGKAMGKTRNLICMNCGFDLKTMKVIKIKTGETTIEEVEAEQKKPKRLSRRGRGDFWLPGTLAGLSTAILLIGYLVGAGGLFPSDDIEKFQGLFEEVGLMIIWIACGLGGLYSLARLQERPMGRWKLALTRVAGIVCTMRLATFLDVTRVLEWPLEAMFQIAIATGASIFFFRLKPRDAGLMVIISAVIFLILYLLAWFIRLVV